MRYLLLQNGLSGVNYAFSAGRNTSRVPAGRGEAERGRGEMYHIAVYLEDGERRGDLGQGLANIFYQGPESK